MNLGLLVICKREVYHTAFPGGFVIERHMPSEDIVRFLNEKPEARGLAVAGMPQGVETSEPKDPFDVMQIKFDVTRSVFAKH